MKHNSGWILLLLAQGGRAVSPFPVRLWSYVNWQLIVGACLLYKHELIL